MNHKKILNKIFEDNSCQIPDRSQAEIFISKIFLQANREKERDNLHKIKKYFKLFSTVVKEVQI